MAEVEREVAGNGSVRKWGLFKKGNGGELK